MYVQGGLPNADRELAALSASLTNGCRYCANVHARRHASLAGSSKTISALYFNRLDTLGPRDRAILEFARTLSSTLPSANQGHIQALRDAGIGTAEIINLIHSVAIFGWANRLMHLLGTAQA